MPFKFNKKELNKPLDKKAEKFGDALLSSGLMLIVYATETENKILFYFCLACIFVGNFLIKFYNGNSKRDNE